MGNSIPEENLISDPAAAFDLPGVGLEEILDAPILQPLMEDFQRLTGAVVAVLDIKGKVLVAVGWQDICTRFHRLHPETSRNCTESDLYLTRNLKQGEYVTYKCRNGLWDVGTPLYVDGVHMGNIYTGQYFLEDEVVDLAAFEARAEAHGFDRAAYMAAVGRVPRLSWAQVQTLMGFLLKFTDLVAGMSLANLRTTALLQKQAQTAAALKISEARFRGYFDLGLISMAITSPEKGWVEVNDELCRTLGFSRDELREMNWAQLTHPDDLDKDVAQFQRVLRGEIDAYRLEKRFLCKNRTVVYTELSVQAVHRPDGAVDHFLAMIYDLTERKLAAEKLADNQRLLAETESIGHVGGWEFSLDTLEQTWTEEVFRIHEVDQDFVPTVENGIKFYTEASRQRIEEALRQATEHGEAFDIELEIITAKGNRKSVHAIGKADQEKRIVHGFFQDITARKQAENELKTSQRQFEKLVTSIPIGVYLIRSQPDETISFEYISPRMAEIFGFEPETLRSDVHLAFSRVHPEDLEAFVQLNATGLRETMPFDWIGRIVVEGVVKWLQIESSPERTANGDVLWHGVVNDITERKKAEEESARLQAQLQQSQKMESLGTLAGGVAHDMNNVLGAILGLASAHIGTQPQGSPLHQALDTICRAAERGGKMVKSLLSFSRQTPASISKLDMNALLREEINLLERTTLAKVRLQMDLEDPLHPVRGDANALSHALMNLCVNAVDAMAEGGMLTLRTRNVDRSWIEVEVEDTGTGMPKEVLKKALDPFFTTKALGKGTGLGLSMVYSTVKAHQGQLEIQSEPGRGTSVRMRFPACGVMPQPPEPSTEHRPEASLRVLNILVVDDDELIQSSIQAMLEVLGHTVILTSSGEEALAKLEAGLEPDAVILDMNMPGLGGAGTLPRLRALNPTVPVLLATGRVDQVATDLVNAHAQVALFPKPYSMKELKQHLEALGRA